MKLIVFYICVTVIGSLKPVASQECMTPTQVAGTCVNVKNCPSVIALLQREGTKATEFARKFLCPNGGKDVLVCCPGTPGRKIRQNLYGPLLPPQCGFSNVSHTKVAGGVPAKLNAWPWMAALGYKDNASSPIEWKCGGSLISTRHVLTAAHCAVLSELSVIRLGELNLKRDDDGAHPIDVGFERKIIHPKFRAFRPSSVTSNLTTRGRRNDIAIIRLDREIQFTYQIHPICLPVGKLRHLDFVNTNPFFAGWGKLSFTGPLSDDLMEIQMPIITTETCKNIYKLYRGSVIDNSLLCVSGAGGKDTCEGDSGGPAMLPINGSYYATGVVMGGRPCGYGISWLSTRVTTYLRFIISNLQ